MELKCLLKIIHSSLFIFLQNFWVFLTQLRIIRVFIIRNEKLSFFLLCSDCWLLFYSFNLLLKSICLLWNGLTADLFQWTLADWAQAKCTPKATSCLMPITKPIHCLLTLLLALDLAADVLGLFFDEHMKIFKILVFMVWLALPILLFSLCDTLLH